MRCLWITRQDPRPADSGELIYTLGLLTSLAVQPGFEITVLAHEPAKPCDGGPPLTWQLHGSIPAGRLKSLASSLPADAFRLGNPIQRAALGRLLERAWDWIVIDQAACAWALPMIPKEAKVAYIAHNHETEVRRQVAADAGGSLQVVNDVHTAARGAEVLYARSWGSIKHWHDPEREAIVKRSLTEWRVDEALMAQTKNALLMHPLPVALLTAETTMLSTRPSLTRDWRTFHFFSHKRVQSPTSKMDVQSDCDYSLSRVAAFTRRSDLRTATS